MQLELPNTSLSFGAEPHTQKVFASLNSAVEMGEACSPCPNHHVGLLQTALFCCGGGCDLVLEEAIECPFIMGFSTLLGDNQLVREKWLWLKGGN